MKENVGAFKTNPAKRKNVVQQRGNVLQSLGTKLFIFFFISMVCVVTVVGMVSYTVSKHAMEDKVAEVSEQSLQQTTEKLDYLLNFYENISLQLLLDQSFISDLTYRLSLIQADTTENRMAVEGKIIEKLKQAATTNKVYIHLFDEKPYMQVDTGRDYVSALFSSGNGTSAVSFYQPYFEKIMSANGQVIWLGGIDKGEPGKEANYISMGKMLKTNVGNYILFIEIKEELIAEAIANAATSSGKLPELVGAEGELIYYAKDQEIANEEVVAVDADPTLDAATEEVTAVAKRTHTEVVLPQLGEGELTGSFIDGDEIVIFSESKRTGWKLIQQISIQELTAGIDRILTVTWIIIAAAIVMSIVLGAIIVRMIGKPIGEIRDLMGKVEQGNLSVRMNTSRKDEIGELAQSFNKMASNIGGLIARTGGAIDIVLTSSSQLQQVSKQMDISAREISIATDEIARGADVLSSQSEDGSAQAISIQQEMKNLAESNEEMQQQALAVKNESQMGILQMDALLHKTNEGEQLTKGTLARAEKLMDNTKEIRKILVLLDDIAKHTNLLSLNAAIEASRAGEHGRGFMVVAQEIRQLADQSRESIIVVSKIIGSIVEEIEQTVTAMNENYPIYQEQIVVAQKVDAIFKAVDGRMNEVVEKIDHASGYVGNLQQAQSTLSEMILHVSSTAEQSTAISQQVASSSGYQLTISAELVNTSQRLNELSNELKEILSQFEVKA